MIHTYIYIYVRIYIYIYIYVYTCRGPRVVHALEDDGQDEVQEAEDYGGQGALLLL